MHELTDESIANLSLKSFETSLQVEFENARLLNSGKKLDPIALADIIFKHSYFMLDESDNLHYYDFRLKRYSPLVEKLLQQCFSLASTLLVQTKSVIAHLTQLAIRDMGSDQLRTIRYKPLPVGQLPLANGILNVLTKDFTAYSPKVTNLNQMSVRYNSNVSKPDYSFDQYVDEFCGHDDKKKQNLFTILRTIIFNVNTNKIFYIYGSAGDGKSTFFVDFLMPMIGESNTLVMNLSQLSDADKLVGLGSSRYCVGDDNDGSIYISATGTLKSIATKGYMSVSRKYLDAVSFQSQAQMVQLVNSIPTFGAKDVAAIARRTVVFEADNRFAQTGRANLAITEMFTQAFMEDALLTILDDSIMPYQIGYDMTDSQLFLSTMTNADEVSDFIHHQLALHDMGDHESMFEHDIIPKSIAYLYYVEYCKEHGDNKGRVSSKQFFNRCVKTLSNLGYVYKASNTGTNKAKADKLFDVDLVPHAVKETTNLGRNKVINGYFRKVGKAKIQDEISQDVKQVTLVEWLSTFSHSVTVTKTSTHTQRASKKITQSHSPQTDRLDTTLASLNRHIATSSPNVSPLALSLQQDLLLSTDHDRAYHVSVVNDYLSNL